MAQTPRDVVETVRQSLVGLLVTGDGLSPEHRRLIARACARLTVAETGTTDEQVGAGAEIAVAPLGVIAAQLPVGETSRALLRLAGHLLEMAGEVRGEYPTAPEVRHA